MCSLNLESCHPPLAQNNNADNKPTYGEVVDLKKQTPNSKKSTWAEIRLLSNDEASRAAAWASTMEVKGLLKGLETSMTFLMSRERRRRAWQIGWQLCTQVLIRHVSKSRCSCQFIHYRLRGIFEWASHYQKWFSFQDYSTLTTQVVAGFCALVMKLQHVCFEPPACSGPLHILFRFQRDHFAKSLFPKQKDNSLGRVCEMCPPKRFWLCTF